MKLALGIALATLIATPTLAQDADSDTTTFSLTTGVDYSSGDYGAPQDTEILVVPVSARLKTGDWRFSATIPYLRIEGAAGIVGGGEGGPIIIDPNAPRVTRDGIGDLTLGATWTAISEGSGPFNLDLGARVKVPVASESKGLGTGKSDFAISADLSRTYGIVTPFVTVGYRFPGDPENFELNNAFSGSVGASVALGKMVAIASYDYRESTSTLVEDGHDLFGALSGPLSSRLNWTLYGSAGLSQGSPDFGVGLMLTARLF